MAVYIEFNKKAIKGNVTAEKYEDCIEVDNFNYGVGRSISMEPGALANRESSKPSLSEISFTKRLDSASGGLFKASVTGSEGVPVTIYIVQTGDAGVSLYAKYELENCIVSSYSVNASAGSAPVEQISLSYSLLKADLTHADKTNKNKQNMIVGYDLVTGKPI